MGALLMLAAGSAIIPLTLEPPPPADPCPLFDMATPVSSPRPVGVHDLAQLADIGRSAAGAIAATTATT